MNLTRAITALRECNEDVPTPPRLPTKEEVDAIERELGVRFHPDFRRYLLEASDVVFGTLEPVTITEKESHTYLPQVARSAWDEMELPRDLLPLCEDNGDYYCINKSGKIVYWSHNGTTDESWPNLATWIEEVWIGESEG
jgi:hypothetical protein